MLDDLINKCKKQDRLSQKKLFDQYYQKMFYIALRYSKDTDEAQDIVQNGFIKIFKNIDNYVSSGSFEGWMRRIITNCAIDYIRKQKISFETDDIESVSDVYEEEILTETKYSSKQIMQAVQNLPPQYRAVFNLYVMEGYSHQEISEILDINIGTSKSNLSKAKNNIRNYLTKNE